MKIKIRKAKIEDAKKISLLKRKTLREINFKDYSKKTINVLIEKNNTKNILKKIKESEIFCLIDSKEIIGTIAIDDNIVHGFFIKYNSIGKGYGKILMNFIENYARKKYMNKLIVYPTITAQKFYEKIGYKKTGETSTWKFDNKVLEENVPIMEKKL